MDHRQINKLIHTVFLVDHGFYFLNKNYEHFLVTPTTKEHFQTSFHQDTYVFFPSDIIILCYRLNKFVQMLVGAVQHICLLSDILSLYPPSMTMDTVLDHMI